MIIVNAGTSSACGPLSPGSLVDWRSVDRFELARCPSDGAYPMKKEEVTVSRPEALPTGACLHPISVPKNPGGGSWATHSAWSTKEVEGPFKGL